MIGVNSNQVHQMDMFQFLRSKDKRPRKIRQKHFADGCAKNMECTLRIKCKGIRLNRLLKLSGVIAHFSIWLSSQQKIEHNGV